MDSTILQIPMSKALKQSSQEVANEYGFSSLQDLLRVVLTKLSRRELIVTIEEAQVLLSDKNEQRYLKMSEDFKKNRNIYHAKSAEDLIKQLHEN